MPSALFLATPARRAVWTRMVQENHPWWLVIKTNALSGTNYFDNGLYGALAYQMTGEATYAAKAHTIISAKFLNKPTIDASLNDVREYSAYWVLCFDWLWDWMGPTQRDFYLQRLNEMATRTLSTSASGLPPSYPTRATDSDQMTGTYFFLTMLRERTAAFNPDIIDIFARVKIGEPDPTEAPPSTSTFRNALQTYCHLARGGEWIESEEYNRGTVKLLTLWAEAMRTALGRDAYPEITAFQQDAVRMLVLRVTPDRKNSFQWGDEESPRAMRLYYLLETLMVLSGLTGSAEARWLIEKIADEQNCRVPSGQNTPVVRGFIVYTPFEEKVEPLHRDSKFAEGHGMLLRRDGEALFQAHFPPAEDVAAWTGAAPGGIDHTPSYFGERQLYCGPGAIGGPGFRSTHPFGYAGPAVDSRAGGGSLRVKGLPYVSGSSWGFREFRHVVGWESRPDYEYIAGTQGGQVMPKSSYQPGVPPSYLHEGTVTFLYIPALGITLEHHRVMAQDPTTLARFTGYNNAAVRDMMTSSPLKQWALHTWTQPTITGKRASFTDSIGEVGTIDVVYPTDASLQVRDEKTLGWPTTNISLTEQRWQVWVTCPDREFDTALFVEQTMVPVPVQAIPGGVLIGSKAFVFNDTPGKRLTGANWSPTNQYALGVAHLRTEPFTTDLAAPADTMFFGLNPSLPWFINGIPLAVSEHGIARIDLAGGITVIDHVPPVQKLPDPPTDLTIEVDMDIRTTIAWKNQGTNRWGNKVYRSTTQAAEALIVELGKDSQVYQDPAIPINTMVTYRVAAFNPFGETSKSGTIPTFLPEGPIDIDIHVEVE